MAALHGMKRRLTRASVAPLAALALVACGSDDPVSVDGAWARASAPGQTRGAVYFDLTVAADDTLVGVSVPGSVAADAQVHQVVMADAGTGHEMSGDEMSGMDDHGHEAGSGVMETGEMSGDTSDPERAMVMREVTGGLALTGGEIVSFEPGGYHVMLLDLVDPLEVGEEIELTLELADAGATEVTVEVAESAP